MSSTENDFFGRSFQCSCGRRHTIEPAEMIWSENIGAELGKRIIDQIKPAATVTTLTDVRTKAVCGDHIKSCLEEVGLIVQEICIPDPSPEHSPVCDDHTHDWLLDRLPSDTQTLIPIGGGVLSDLGKWLAFDLQLPYFCVATAASMNGYGSANVAPSLKGVKSLLRASPPRAVLAQPSVIINAPYHLTTSGLGDILAKSVSSADWAMNHILFGDYFCQESVSIINHIEPLYMGHPERIKAKSPTTMKALFTALILTGSAMTMAGSSAPASGGEHMTSHALDMMSSLDKQPHDLHGRQVGVGTILASAVYQKVLNLESPKFSAELKGVDLPFWGKLADEVKTKYEEKKPRIAHAATHLAKGNNWDELRNELYKRVRAPESIHACLQKADAAYTADAIKSSPSRLLSAFTHAHEMRSRFTILDLGRICGVLPQHASKLVEAWCTR